MAATLPYDIVVAPAALVQIEAALRWWRRNRSAAPNLLAGEIDDALGVIEEAPQIGRRVLGTQFHGVRRLLLQRTGFHIYYRVDDALREIRIVYFRHTRRRPVGGPITR